MAGLTILAVILVCIGGAISNRYDDLLADMYGLPRDRDDIPLRKPYFYGRREGAVASRGSQFYGDLLGATQTRDQEYEPPVPALYGYKYISGGAGEGKQHLTPSGSVDNKEEVKTDKVLPAYCNPPNPCPIGFTAKDNCVENFENSADHNRKYNNEQLCSCDAEHMFQCPDEKNTISAKVHGGDDDESAANLGDVINQLINLEGTDVDYILDLADKGNDHATISKKSLSRKKRALEYAELPTNPYLAGVKLARAAKKSPSYRQRFPGYP